MWAARDMSIWWWAFGYFATYVPYSALTKALSEGAMPGMSGRVDGFVLLPATGIACLVGSMTFLLATGWWQTASRVTVLGQSFPRPTRWSALSGLCASAIMVTTTLAYTFEGTSIVLMMLLMRGIVLGLAPVVDLISRRPVRGRAWVALGLSFAALVVAFRARGSLTLSAPAILCLALYGSAYFVRLRVMSRAAKTEDGGDNRRFFVEEQLVSAPAVLTVLCLWALIDTGPQGVSLRQGFGDFLLGPMGAVAFLAGLCSQGTGIFGSLVLLDKRENTFCIPVNRASSVLAGVAASGLLAALLPMMRLPATGELLGAALMIGALVVLALPSRSRA